MSKSLTVTSQIEQKPQYGGRTMIEKVKAYKLSDGEIIESRELALELQREIDIRARIDIFVDEFFTDEVLVQTWRIKNLLWHRREELKNKVLG